MFTVEGLAIPAHYPPITALTSCVNGVIEVCPHVNNQQENPPASKSAHFLHKFDPQFGWKSVAENAKGGGNNVAQ